MITQDELKHRLSYSEETGLFTWVNPTVNNCKVGSEAGTSLNGYRRIMVNGRIYMAHRLAWLYVHGYTPEHEIDHINGNRSDNRICNLRLATHKQNMENTRLQMNNTSGHRGVTWDRNRQKWIARINHFNEVTYLGRYANIEDAVTAVKNARDCCFTHHKTSYSA